MSLASFDGAVAGLAEELPDAVIVLDGSGRVEWGNRAAERLFGRSLDDSIGLPALDLVHPDDLELVLRSFSSVQNKEVGTLIEVRAKAGTGWRLLEIIGTPIDWSGEAAVLFCLRDLTERRRFEVARDEVSRFRSLVQNAAALTLLVSPAGFLESASGALSRLLGHDPERVEQRPLAELVREVDRPVLLAALELAAKGAPASNPVKVNVRLLRHASEEAVPFELSIVNLLNDPTVGGFVISAHDTTARSAAELERDATLSLLTATLDATADGIVVVDLEGRITSFNCRVAEMWRLPAAVLDTRDARLAREFVSDQLADPAAFAARLAKVHADPELDSSDVLEFADGRVFERHSRPQRLGGEIVGRVWSFRDVTESRRAEAELRASEERFRQVFEQGPLPIAVVDLASRITNANNALCELLGRRPEEVVGATLESFAHPDDVEHDAELARQLSEGTIGNYQTETRLLTSGGEEVVGTVTASVVQGGLGTPLYGLRIVEDVTKRRTLEQELFAHATTAGKLLGSLTTREKEILELLGRTERASEIARYLSVSVRTVETHLANAYRKLGVRTREAAAAEFARLNRLVAALIPAPPEGQSDLHT